MGKIVGDEHKVTVALGCDPIPFSVKDGKLVDTVEGYAATEQKECGPNCRLIGRVVMGEDLDGSQQVEFVCAGADLCRDVSAPQRAARRLISFVTPLEELYLFTHPKRGE